MENNIKKRKVRLEVFIEILILVFIIVMTATTYNSMVKLRSNVREQYAQIENVLQARLEKVPDLMTVVKSYAVHEETVFQNITDAENELQEAIRAGNISQIALANDTLTETMKKLDEIVEAYPELTSSKLYVGLMDEIAESVNRISQERRKYNQAVSEYNNKLQTFPANIFASILDFPEAVYFEAQPEARVINVLDN